MNASGYMLTQVQVRQKHVPITEVGKVIASDTEERIRSTPSAEASRSSEIFPKF
jgi:hypothetical protein